MTRSPLARAVIFAKVKFAPRLFSPADQIYDDLSRRVSTNNLKKYSVYPRMLIVSRHTLKCFPKKQILI